jgi:hypothetical protein
MSAADLVNKGVIFRRGVPVSPAIAALGRTFLVSGLGRGGTTMLANLTREALLHKAGRDGAGADPLHDTFEVLNALRSSGVDLDAFIARENARFRDWGLKAPMLAGYLAPHELTRFRNPHLLMVFRDPVAIAVRAAKSESVDVLTALRSNAEATPGLLSLVEGSTCPALLISYEKAITFPDDLVDALIQFCGSDGRSGLRERLLACVEPNSETYIKTARRAFEGMVDLVWQWQLHGWCWDSMGHYPVDLDIFLDGVRAATVRADMFRADLKAAGVGDGRHGFIVDLAALGARPETRVEVRVTDRIFELTNSGRQVRSYPGFAA